MPPNIGPICGARQSVQTAYQQITYAEAKRSLGAIAAGLKKTNESAAGGVAGSLMSGGLIRSPNSLLLMTMVAAGVQVTAAAQLPRGTQSSREEGLDDGFGIASRHARHHLDAEVFEHLYRPRSHATHQDDAGALFAEPHRKSSPGAWAMVLETMVCLLSSTSKRPKASAPPK